MTSYGHAKRGFEYPLIKFVLITETDIFGQEKKKRRKKIYFYLSCSSSYFSISVYFYPYSQCI